MKFFNKIARDESGATAIEYGLIAGLIAIVIIGGVSTIGGDLSTRFEALSGAFTPKSGT